MSTDRIESELLSLEPLRVAVKARSMVYQADLKERRAVENGLPADAYYDLPYSEWAAIRDGRSN